MFISKQTIENYYRLDESLGLVHKEEIKKADELAEKIVDPLRSSASDVWKIIWDKPLYSNVYVDTAKRWRCQIEPFVSDAWKSLGDRSIGLEVVRNLDPVCSRKRCRNCFPLHGKGAEAFKLKTRMSTERLYRIQSAARALRHRAANNEYPFFDLDHEVTVGMVRKLNDEFGYGWGDTTVMHLLTDFGMCIKPDIHLINSMTRIGLIHEVKRPSGYNLSEKLSFLKACQKLISKLGLKQSRQELRRLDYKLMAFSRNGLVPKPESLFGMNHSECRSINTGFA